MKNFLIALVLVGVVAIGGYSLFLLEKPDTTLGAVSGPEQNSSPFYSWNGIVIWPYRSVMNQASTTRCSFKSPGATTTVRAFTANFIDATSTAATVYLARGATYQATTTNFETFTLAANAQGLVIASTTGRTNGLPIVPPNTYLTVGELGAVSFRGTGTCNLMLEGV